jgi:hypothetical protein
MKLRPAVVGTYRQDTSPSRTLIRLSLLPRDMAMQWRRCGLTADFVAGFFAYRYPRCRPTQNSLSTILNEIVENAVKFSSPDDSPIEISLFDADDEIVLQVDNWAQHEQASRFLETARAVLDAADLEARYMDTLRKNALTADASGIGLLTLIHDFKVAVGVRLAPAKGPGFSRISIQVRLNPEEALT